MIALWTTTTTASSQASFLLLPLEIRSEIYQLLELSGPITIGSELCEDKDFQSCIPGLPPNHVPIIRASFDKELLRPPHINTTQTQEPSGDITEPENTQTVNDNNNDSKASYASASCELIDTLCSLRLTCRQIASELSVPGSPSSLINRHKPDFDLYLSYPHGVCIAVHEHYGVLRQARNIKIAGAHYFKRSEKDKTKPPWKSHSWTDLERLDSSSETRDITPTLDTEAQLVAAQTKALQTLVWLLLGHVKAAPAEQNGNDGTPSNHTPIMRTIGRHTPHRPSRLHKLHVRIFFSTRESLPLSPNSYSTYCHIWEKDESPVPLVLGAICGGDIVLSCARGRQNVGVEIVARDNGGKPRCVTGVWPSLEEPRRGTIGEVGRCWWTEDLEVGKEGVNFGKVKGADEIRG